ncbi:MAG: hypothetical protein R3264_14965 [Anaerolineae bacterium]|nr:hypothetical protein [Anaerolineae bacterium]
MDNESPTLASQLEYLEQRHQADKEKIARLEQLVEAQKYEIQEQTVRLQKFSEDLAEAKLVVKRVPALEEELARFRGEILQSIEQRYDRRSHGVELENGLSSQIDNHTKALHELRRELDKTQRYEEQILLARTEIERLSKKVSEADARSEALSKQLAEGLRSSSYQDEQRQTDAHRIAELQREFPSLQQQMESSLVKIQTIEKQIPQYGKYEIALEELRDEIRRHREHMDFQMAQRERLMKNWSDMVDSQTRRMKDNEKLMDKYVEHYQLNKRALASLQEFQEQLQREQHQSEELQRLTEKRQRATMEKIQADYEQRWQKYGMELQPRLEDLQKELAKLKGETDSLAKFDQHVNEQITMILQILEEDIQSRAAATQEWQDRFEQLASGKS